MLRTISFLLTSRPTVSHRGNALLSALDANKPEKKMEMHTSETLYARYGIVVQPQPRRRWLWIESLAICCWIRQAIRRERELRRATVELKNLSDHLLKDIGISRCG